jgi:hypothetical protein
MSEPLPKSRETLIYYDIYDLSKTLKINIVVKNGLISSIYGNNNLKNANSKMSSTINITGNVRQGPIVSINNLNTVTCEQLFGQRDPDNLCTPNYNPNNIQIPEPPTQEDTKKATDAYIKATLSNMRVSGELYYESNKSYGPMISSCYSGMFDSTTAGGFRESISALKSKTNDIVCNASIPGADNRATAWLVSAKLNTGPWFCVDSTGAAVTNNMQKSGADTKCQ